MIARELLVKLGFDIDEKKLEQFTSNVDRLKSKMADIKGKLALNIDDTKLTKFADNVDALKHKMANAKGRLGLGFDIDDTKLTKFSDNVDALKHKMANAKGRLGLGFDIDDTKLTKFSDNVDAIKSKISNVKGKFGFDIDGSKTKEFLGDIKTVKAEMSDLKSSIRERLNPEIDSSSLKAYKKELASFPEAERAEILKLNAIEKESLKEQLQNDKARYASLQAVHSKLAETQKNFKAAAAAAKTANLTFSRYFTRFTLVGSGSFFLALRNTLKEANEFEKRGAGGLGNIFSSKQLDSVNQFNKSLKQTKKTIGVLRNSFVISLLPAFKEHLDALNNWLIKNKKLIQTKLKNFVEILGYALRNLSTSISYLFSVLDPLVSLIGGWGMVITGFIGAGILSWIVRLGIFIRSSGVAILFFSGTIRTLTAALLANPIGRIISIIVSVLVMLADEFFVTAKGGDSLMNRFKGLKKIGDKFIETLKSIWEWLIKVKDNMFDFASNLGAGAKDMFNGVVDDAKKTAKGVSDAFSNIFGPGDLEKKLQVRLADRKNPGFKIIRSDSMIHKFPNLQKPSHNSSTHKNINISQKPNITLNLAAPESGKLDIQSINEQIQKALELQNVKLAAAIGAV